MKSEKMRRALTENMGLKIVSLLTAILLWMFVIGEKQSDVQITVPLSLTNLPVDMVITSRVPSSVNV
ncbi:YbbR-like domain-containing protein, partial [bacterium]